MATLSPDQRELIAYLRRSNVVKKIKYNFYHISIWYNDGYKERWALNPARHRSRGRIIIPRRDVLRRPIPAYCEFNSRLLDEQHSKLIQPHFVYQYTDFLKAGFGDVRLKIHEIIYRLLEEGWVNPHYPQEALDQDWYDLEHRQWESYAPSLNMVNLYGGIRTPGFVTAINFMEDAGSSTTGYRTPLREAWKDRILLRMAIEYLLKMGKDITRIKLIRAFCTGVRRYHTYPAGFRFPSPLFYKALFTKIFKIKKPTVLDITPGHGSALLGTALLDGKYYYQPDGDFGYQATRLGDHLAMEVAEDDGDVTADIGLTGVRSYSVNDALQLIDQYKNRCETLIIPMSPWFGKDLAAVRPPRRILRARLGHKQHYIYDSLFLY